MEFSEKHTLVTGAHGWIGRNLCARLSAEGHHVTGIGHGDWREVEWRNCGLSHWLSSDIDSAALLKLPALPSLVFHCAGGSSVKESFLNPAADRRRTVGAAEELLSFIGNRCPDARVVFLSSAAVYGNAPSGPIDEEKPLNPISPYGHHKLHTEELGRNFGRQQNGAGVIVRLFSVYGPGLRKQLLWDASRKVANGDNKFFGTGAEIRDWLFISDAIDLIIKASRAAAPSWPILNGGTGIGTRNLDLLESLFERLGSSRKPEFEGITRAGDPNAYVADIRRARATGWMPRVSLEEGLDRYAAWFKKEMP